MTLDEAIDEMIARTRNPRFRWLCSDDNPDVESRLGYRAHVLTSAGQPMPVLDDAARAAALIAANPPTSPVRLGGCCN